MEGTPQLNAVQFIILWLKVGLEENTVIEEEMVVLVEEIVQERETF